MNLLYANPLTLAYHYLLLFFHGTPLEDLHGMFSKGDREKDSLDTGSNGQDQGLSEVYDFIVVGGGSAGSAVVNRLTEENFTVLLLEAGGNPFPLTAVPSLAPFNLNSPLIDWNDQAVSQRHACQALNNKGPKVNRGKALGGGSNLNWMIVMRGHPNDYNNWAEETGDPSWSYENLLPYFKKLENYHGHFPDDTYHGKEGPIHVSSPSFKPLVHEWLAAGEELGYPMRDPNGAQEESFFPFDLCTKAATRFSTHRGYLYPALSRPNLNIKIYAHATKIIFDDNNRATGVEYFKNGKKYVAAATKEVILSAGAIGSPQLLMLSGIGPEAQLKPRGIRVRANLPVGQSLQDHIMVYLGPFVIDEGHGLNAGRDLNMKTLAQYIMSGEGPFGSHGVVAGAITSSSMAVPGWPDLYIKLILAGVNEQTAGVFRDSFNVRPGIIERYFKPDDGKDAFFIVPVLGLAKTRGEVKLRSDSPFDRVDVNPMYFTDPEDFKIMMEGMKFALKLSETEAFKKIGAKLTTSLFPGCERYGNASNDAYLECYVRQWTHTVWHFSCTNRMGKGKDDPTAVVDPELRVIGTQGLRVMDASIMPKLTNANTNIPAIMIGEKGADLVKKTWAASK